MSSVHLRKEINHNLLTQWNCYLSIKIFFKMLLDSFNLTKGLAIVLIFGGVYLVTISKSRKEMEAHEQQA